jgi:hypothetical protein
VCLRETRCRAAPCVSSPQSAHMPRKACRGATGADGGYAHKAGALVAAGISFGMVSAVSLALVLLRLPAFAIGADGTRQAAARNADTLPHGHGVQTGLRTLAEAAVRLPWPTASAATRCRTGVTASPRSSTATAARPSPPSGSITRPRRPAGHPAPHRTRRLRPPPPGPHLTARTPSPRRGCGPPVYADGHPVSAPPEAARRPGRWSRAPLGRTQFPDTVSLNSHSAVMSATG